MKKMKSNKAARASRTWTQNVAASQHRGIVAVVAEAQQAQFRQ